MKQRISIIGAGFSGLSAAAFLSRQGYAVDVFEKHSIPGGRARAIHESGFTFDMGPTWYWLPDVFEKFFDHFGAKLSDYYSLHRLDPAYRVYFGAKDFIDVPAGLDKIYPLFDSIEPGSGRKLKRFMKDAAYKYELGIGKLVYKPSLSIFEFFEPWVLRGLVHGDFFRSVSSVIRANFKEERLIRILEFPVIFLGATPWETPSLYSLMNYADMGLGTWYPDKGMYSVVDGIYTLAKNLGVNFHLNSPVEKIITDGRLATGLQVSGEMVPAEVVLSSADYHHTETDLLAPGKRSYRKNYWDSREMAPSALLYYLGINKKLKNLLHHNLFFDEDFNLHAQEIYKNPKWPTKPSIYVSCSSITDSSVAPYGHENIIILIPVAPGLEDNEEIREKYFTLAMERIENLTGQEIKPHIIFKRSYAHSDFIHDYHAFKGNAYGLANTLRQTAIFKPSLRSKKVHNLFFSGQLTVPGPGVPPSLISGQVAAKEIDRYLQKK